MAGQLIMSPIRVTVVPLIFLLGLVFLSNHGHVTNAQSPNQPSVNAPSDSPVGWRASYTQIYSDDVESLQPTVGPQFLLESAGALTSAAGEVITGTRSIKGSNTGAGSFTPYLRTNTATLSFTPSQMYRVTFKYKILITPDKGFECLFFSPTGAAAGNFLPSTLINGPAGTTVTATLTNTLGPYTDYQALWNVVGTGTIAIDDIRIEQLPGGQTTATEDGEHSSPSLSPGLRINGSGSVTTDANQVVNGGASVRLTNFASLETNPAVLPLLSNTYYVLEFNYRILNRGSDDTKVAFVNFQPAGSNDQSLGIYSGVLLKNAEPTGTFSTGSLTASSGPYVLRIYASQNAVIAVDDIRLARLDPTQISSQPAAWTALASRPYPRLGNCQQNTPNNVVQASSGEGVPFAYTAQQIEERLAFADVVVEEQVITQTQDSDFVRRLQRRNPNIVVLPYHISEELGTIPSQYAPNNATVDLDWQFQSGLDNSWFARDTHGNQISELEPAYAFIKMMDVSPSCPVVNGNTFISYQNDWILTKVLRSGIWDGIFLDNLFARINPHIPNFWNGSLLDIDLNRNGVRDETPAAVSNTYRAGATQILQSIRGAEGDLTILMGNAGNQPELSLAPYLNGYLFECVNGSWNAPYLTTGFSEPNWRSALDDYLAAQSGTRLPHTNILEGCGRHQGLAPTTADIRDERMVTATTLLSDGFSEYDLFDARSAPFWFDEYSVDGAGTAVEDPRYKGYLGQALGPASELTSPATQVWAENFETTFPSALTSSDLANTYITHVAGEVISGGGSLVLNNPNHAGTSEVKVWSNTNQVPLSAGRTYVVEFDWRILETLDDHLQVDVANGGTGSYGLYNSIVAGDSGKAHFPVTLQPGTGYQVVFRLLNGGKIAIDNIKVTDGGAGPWRRDFEKGIVIVNPLNRPYTFTPTELAGPYSKTGIKRIHGTQDPTTNNGQPVNGGFTIGAADAIILLSDPTAPTAIPKTLQFSAANYTVGEGAGNAMVTVNRNGDSSGAASVQFGTSDGTAKEGRDYTAAFGALNFAAGETSKTFPVLVIDNGYVAGTRTVNLTLSSPTGAALSAQSTAVLNITENDTSPSQTNPLDQTRFFVQQHYYDFLGRFPDQAGWDFWTSQITNCGANQGCIDVSRVSVSASFFLSIEFQQTGYLIEKLYKAAYGDATGSSFIGGTHSLQVPIVRFNEFLPDTAQIGSSVIVGQTGWETVLENNKQTFAATFVQRSRFTTAFPTTMTPALFVDKLFLNAGVTPTADDRTMAINEFGSATTTTDTAARGRALRRVAENSTLNTQEFNRAFVLMQYFGYLRRDPNSGPDNDHAGYEFWLTKLNAFNGNYLNAEMVKAFITSIEYRQRFGL